MLPSFTRTTTFSRSEMYHDYPSNHDQSFDAPGRPARPMLMFMAAVVAAAAAAALAAVAADVAAELSDAGGKPG